MRHMQEPSDKGYCCKWMEYRFWAGEIQKTPWKDDSTIMIVFSGYSITGVFFCPSCGEEVDEKHFKYEEFEDKNSLFRSDEEEIL